ncbi:SsgA family sporulation/cell division regulator [soil metagenome]
MLARSSTVNAVVDFDLFDDQGRLSTVHAELHYDSADPYAIRGDFCLEGQVVRWVFARTLLRTGLYEPTGEGDVRMRPWLDDQGKAVLVMDLCSPDGSATMQAPSSHLATFLRRTESLVPLGTESTHVEFESALRQLLQEDRT